MPGHGHPARPPACPHGHEHGGRPRAPGRVSAGHRPGLGASTMRSRCLATSTVGMGYMCLNAVCMAITTFPIDKIGNSPIECI